MTTIARRLRLAFAFLLAGSFALQAEVVRIEIVSRTDCRVVNRSASPAPMS